MRLSWASLLAATTRFAAMAWAEDIKGSFARAEPERTDIIFSGVRICL